ncbi:MAG TPA: hypothetical protein VNY05_07450 [Candidatus Acidoferrales bacterium]|jgi:hypothetical protein|nr:hypothetical protein [Candidatus Acidoferrales bacterium]
MIKNCTPAAIGAIYLAICSGPAAVAQVNADRANQYFGEAAALCAHEGGSLWKTSLCGPIVIYDASTKTIATNQPAPAASKPPVLGYANAAMDWGGTRWSTLVW